MRYLRIIDALEIKIVTEYDNGESQELQFSWFLKSYKEQSLEI